MDCFHCTRSITVSKRTMNYQTDYPHLNIELETFVIAIYMSSRVSYLLLSPSYPLILSLLTSNTLIHSDVLHRIPCTFSSYHTPLNTLTFFIRFPVALILPPTHSVIHHQHSQTPWLCLSLCFGLFCIVLTM